MKEPCLFCRVVNGEINHGIVYKDHDTLAMVDLRQPRAGHTLIIPTQHVEDVFELDEVNGAALMRTVVAVAKAVRAAFSPEGLSLWQSNGPAAFQEVPHLHVHVMPRWSNDGLLRIYPHRLEPISQEELEHQAATLKRALTRP